MAKNADIEKSSFKTLENNFRKGKIPNNLILFIRERTLLDYLILAAGENFVGKEFNISKDVRKFHSDEGEIDQLINECSNLNFFSEKKIVLYKIIKKQGVKGLAKDSKEALQNYFARFNPDTLLILLIQDKEINTDNFADLLHTNVKAYDVGSPNEADLTEWVRMHLDGYKIEDETIFYLLQFLNPSLDEITSEIEKLKIYCFNTREITRDSVNMCVGISKDFNEIDFIEAVLSRDTNNALKIYDNLFLKEDLDVFLVFLLCSAFSAIYKLYDNETTKLQGFHLYKELKLWRNAEKTLALYHKYKNSTNELKIIKAFNYIYTADKALKTSRSDKRTIFATLIVNLTTL